MFESCDKRCFSSRKNAKRAASKYQGKGLMKTRPYFCTNCECFHLTSLNGKGRAIIRKIKKADA